MEPALLLLDEPLSNLDAKLREQMRFELKRLQRELGITTVYVTHDQSEALALSHEIAVMNAGPHRAGRHARATSTSGRANPFVADFVGTTNFIDGAVRRAPNRRRLYPRAHRDRRSRRARATERCARTKAWCCRSGPRTSS